MDNRLDSPEDWPLHEISIRPVVLKSLLIKVGSTDKELQRVVEDIKFHSDGLWTQKFSKFAGLTGAGPLSQKHRDLSSRAGFAKTAAHNQVVDDRRSVGRAWFGQGDG